MDTFGVKTDGDSPAESQPREESPQTAAADNGIQVPKKPNVRKRTKTGCLSTSRWPVSPSLCSVVCVANISTGSLPKETDQMR